MKNSLLLNNFVKERPKTAHSKQSRPGTVYSSRSRKEPVGRSISRVSSEFQSPRDTSSRLGYKERQKLLQDGRRESVCSQIYSDQYTSGSDSEEDDYVDNKFGNKADNYWSSLDDSIKRINDDSDKFAFKPRPNFKSSGDFKDVMTEMSGNTEYGVSKGYTLLKDKISRLTNVSSITALALLQATKQDSEPDETDSKTNESESEDELQEEITRETREKELVSSIGGAKRSWRVLKTHVKENAVEHRTTSVKMNWEAIRHHVSGITDLDKARKDLYQRYGFLPTVQEDGSKVCKNVMWLNRTRARIMENQNDNLIRGKLRAQSARPFTNQNSDRYRSLSGSSFSNGYSRPASSKISDVSKVRIRPMSEKITRSRLRPSSVKPPQS